jgi:hypothetical protein
VEATLEERNAALRGAVESRLAVTVTTTETQPQDREAIPVRPGSEAFIAVLEEVKRLHLKKSLDYGADEDALMNIRDSADVINVQAWAGAILRISDKMHRLRSFFRRGVVEFDGIEDTLLDMCSYAAIALVMYREAIKRART